MLTATTQLWSACPLRYPSSPLCIQPSVSTCFILDTYQKPGADTTTSFAFVEYEDRRDSEDAYHEMHNKRIGRDDLLKIEVSRPAKLLGDADLLTALQWARTPPSASWRFDSGREGGRDGAREGGRGGDRGSDRGGTDRGSERRGAPRSPRRRSPSPRRTREYSPRKDDRRERDYDRRDTRDRSRSPDRR